jgi:hypothetical protein
MTMIQSGSTAKTLAKRESFSDHAVSLGQSRLQIIERSF